MKTTTRRAAIALLAIFVVGCHAGSGRTPSPEVALASSPAPRAAPVPSSSSPPPSPAGPLPAGLYFRDGCYERGACPECVEPRWAVVSGIFESPSDATEAVRQAPSVLAVGYPWAVHTDELALLDESRRGIAVVVGLFESEVAAERYGAAVGDGSAGWEHLPLASRAAALERLHERLGRGDYGETRVHVVQVDRGATGHAAAYLGADLDPLIREIEMSSEWESFEAYIAAIRSLTERVEPACRLPSGTVQAVRGNEALYRFFRHYVPVECPDGRQAYLPASDTRLETVVLPRGGDARLVQVVVVECDVPTFEEWGYSAAGRRPLEASEERLALATGSCGEP